MSDKKYVGPIAAAKIVTLIKAALEKKLDKSGGTITGSLEINGDMHAGGAVQSDLLLSAPSVTVHNDTAASVHISCSGDNAARISSLDSNGKLRYARLAVGTPTGDNDATTKAYVDGRTHDYYDVTVISAADAAQTIDGGIISVRGSADKTVAEIAAAYAAGAIVRCIYGGNIMQLVRAADGSYSFAGVGANYGVARSGNITITIMSTSNGDATLITSAAGELPIPDSDVSQNGCALVVADGKWQYSDDKLIPATPTSNGLMSAADKKKLDSMYDIVATSTDGETFDITPAQLHEKLKGVPTTCAIKVVDTIIPLYRVQLQSGGDTRYIFQITKDNGVWEPNTRLTYTASAGGTYAGTIWGKSEYDLLASTPGILKFTGAAEAQFSGSKDVTIDIPTGEGAVRYDETQKLTSDQKFRASQNIGAVSQKHAFIDGVVMLQAIGHDDGVSVVNITPSEKSNDYTLALDAGPENVPVCVSGIETPTDAQTDCATNVAYVKAKIAEVAASGGVDVDNALSATSTNPVQNKVVTSALTGKAGTAVATTSANGLMSKADKTKLDDIERGANKTTIDTAMSGTSTNPVQNKVIKQYVDDKVAAAGSNITVDAALDASSTNPVQNKAVKAAIDGNKTALGAKMDKSGGTFTGNVYGKYFCGTWLQSTEASDLGRTPDKIAVLDGSGWVYYRTPAELVADLGITNAIKSYVDSAIAVAINSAY